MPKTSRKWGCMQRMRGGEGGVYKWGLGARIEQEEEGGREEEPAAAVPLFLLHPHGRRVGTGRTYCTSRNSESEPGEGGTRVGWQRSYIKKWNGVCMINL